ncbi:15-hydroxyprostaglandin dehydrogenase [NAD(+)]-like [Neodiprion virginianus]|uniref:15-hydroxyprostaglandin dehydrogenase [NAD(+)]-like n=1 Tax=Neodiprion virginianus TaxID=2961670 RepID=UPI001EE6E0E0|nr:15-hydroxyprostaglandin dehydrogenase [NAD(+)]-like [Neodiprion virginianus]
MDVKNKIALVTGGANGIGFAYVRELLKNGAAHVALLDLANSNGDESARKLNEEFGADRVLFVVCDVTKSEEFEAAFAKTVKEFGGLDIVINNAGIMDDARWELEIAINYTAVVRGTLLGYRYMGKDKGNKGGVIVNISSVAGLVTGPTFPIYIATKHAVIGLTRSFGLPYHFEKTGVRVVAMCPFFTNTQLITASAGRTLESVSAEDLEKSISPYPMQTPESVAEGVLHIIRVGDNGSLWVVQNGEPAFEVQVADQPVKKVSA